MAPEAAERRSGRRSQHEREAGGEHEPGKGGDGSGHDPGAERVAGLGPAERERLIRFYPLIRDWMEQLRMVEARYEEQVLIYPAAPRE